MSHPNHLPSFRRSRTTRRLGSRLSNPHSQLATRQAFTLIELLLVLIILAILAGVVVRNFTGYTEHARQAAAKSDIETYRSALASFEANCSRFPTTEEGLQALVVKPADIDQNDWKHSYVDTVKKDPWGHDYIYRCPSTGGKDFDLLSGGPDGREGGGDDITN